MSQFQLESFFFFSQWDATKCIKCPDAQSARSECRQHDLQEIGKKKIGTTFGNNLIASAVSGGRKSAGLLIFSLTCIRLRQTLNLFRRGRVIFSTHSTSFIALITRERKSQELRCFIFSSRKFTRDWENV